MSKQITENSEMEVSIEQFEQLAKTMQSFKDKEAMLVSFTSVLLTAADMIEHERDQLINQFIRLDEQSCDLYEGVADMYKIFAYDCENNEPTPDKVEFAKLCYRIENILRTSVQHSKGCVDKSKGHFYASEANLSQLCEDSLKALDETVSDISAGKTIQYVEIH